MLLTLLRQSREKLRLFNMTDAEIAREKAVDAGNVENAEKVACVRAEWYASLVRWAADARRTGAYALCFSASQVQRKPYDMLAVLPLTAEETEQATEETLPDRLLQGLTDEEKTRARRLYHRLLCIQPMRLLLDRLLQLDAALAETAEGERPARLRAETAKAAFRAVIPETMERSSGQRLDLEDNDFTILDRLMDNWDRTLQEKPEIVVPMEVINNAANEQTLLAATVAYGSRGDMPAGGSMPYRAVPGGHVALGVYADGAPEKVFESVMKGQKEGAGCVLRVRGYAGTRLVQLSDEACGAFSRVKFSRNAVGKPAGQQKKAFCAVDDGGKHLLPLLAQEIEARETLQDEPWLELLLKGSKLAPAAQDKALSMLQDCAAAFFAEMKLPCRIGEYVAPVRSKSSNLGIRAVRLLLADMAGQEMLRLPCPDGQPPEELCRYLTSMKDDKAKLAAFLERSAKLKPGSVWLDLRYAVKKPRTLSVLRTDETAHAAVAEYLQSAAQALAAGCFGAHPRPAFSGEELRQACLQGLRRLLFSGNNIGTGSADFVLAGMETGKKSPKKAVDDVFQLFCLWCVHRRNGGEEVLFRPDERNAGETSFMVRNGPVRIVDLIDGKKAEAAEGAERFTPEALHDFLAGIVGMKLVVNKTLNGMVWTVESPA